MSPEGLTPGWWSYFFCGVSVLNELGTRESRMTPSVLLRSSPATSRMSATIPAATRNAYRVQNQMSSSGLPSIPRLLEAQGRYSPRSINQPAVGLAPGGTWIPLTGTAKYPHIHLTGPRRLLVDVAYGCQALGDLRR